MEKLENQPCPVCHKKTLVLSEEEMDIPYFGKTYLFSMACTNCKYSKSDVEAEEMKEPCRITFEVQKEEDMKVRVVKSSEGSIKIPQLRMSVESGPASDGYISNIEGLLARFEKIIEDERDLAEEDEVKTHAKNLLKKIRKVKWGEMPIKIIIEDPTGNSAIISDRAVVEKMKKK
jgi:zinc finger protein